MEKISDVLMCMWGAHFLIGEESDPTTSMQKTIFVNSQFSHFGINTKYS